MESRAFHMTIRKKLTIVFTVIVIIMFAVELMICAMLNESINEINEVYATNVDNNELLDTLNMVQQYSYKYLNTRSSDSLENFYRYEEKYQELIDNLSDSASDNEVEMLEKNIREMSKTYISTLDKMVLAKRGRNVEKYKEKYEEATKLYAYINNYIESSNEKHFRKNSARYNVLAENLHKLERISFYIMIGWAVLCIYMIWTITGGITGPLTKLAETVYCVSAGNFDVEIPKVDNNDEVGVVTHAFDVMMKNIRSYIREIEKNKEKEKQMLEQELLMENYVKDAQLKYLQAQINPHFLYNSLNAGVQLSMMEGAEKTSVFLEKMAYFFRYNVRKMQDDATLFEEIETVDNYIYIINVRFAGDIHFEKEVASDVPDILMPSMILQPIVENSVNHGIRDIDWEKKIWLKIEKNENRILIQVRDNGKGMTKDKIQSILDDRKETFEEGGSTSVGLHNVRKRLQLYYGKKNLLQIYSEGDNKGTTVNIYIEVKGS